MADLEQPRQGRAPARLVAHLGEIVFVVGADGRVLSAHDDSGAGPGPEPGPALSRVHPEDRHLVADAFVTLLRDPSARTRTLVRARRQGQPYRHMETTGTNRCDDPDVGGLVFVARDVEAQVQLARSAERSLQGQRLVAELGVQLLVDGVLDHVLDEALARTAALLEAQYVTVLERDVAGDLRVTRCHGARPLVPGHLLPGGAGPLCELEERGVLTTAEAPLQGPHGPVGLLAAAWTGVHAFDETERQLLQGVANVLAGARQRERREVEAVLRALHDPLTGLPARALLLDRVDHALRRSARGSGEVALLLVDLDRFKEVNDRHGHAAGDVVLSELGRRLAAHVRPGDTAARLGGDEFVVLCEDVAGPEAVLDLRDRVQRVFDAPFEVPGAGPLPLSGSVGASFSGSCGHDRDALLHAADQAMYRDKRSRRR